VHHPRNETHHARPRNCCANERELKTAESDRTGANRTKKGAAAMGDNGLERFTHKREELEIDKLFRAVVKLEGSDLHLKVDKPPFVRVKGSLRPMSRGPITDDEMTRMCLPLLDERNRKIFVENGGADFAYVVDVDGINWRFRVNL